MFDSKSVYALNKMDSEAIVCPDVTGTPQRLTRDDFSTEEEFLFWKNWSDQDYHLRDRENTEENDNTVSVDALPELAISAPSVEDLLIREEDHKKRAEIDISHLAQIRSILTDRQFRRLLLYHGKALTEAQISNLESVGQQRISKSIVAAERKIKKFYKKTKKRG